MAHGTPRLNICHKCKQYIWVPRFDTDPICPDCGEKSEQTNKEEIRLKYKLSVMFYKFVLIFDHWEKLKEEDEIR